MAANPTPPPDTAVAQLNIPDFVTKWDLRFADNTIQNIRESDFREFKNDLVKVFANWKELTTRRVKGSTYPVPFTDSLGTIPALYLVAGMNAVAVNGTDSASAAAGDVAPSITYQLIRDSTGPVSALTDVAPATTTRTPTRWVQVSGPQEERVASFPELIQGNDYRAGDVFQYTFEELDPPVTRLFAWRDDSTGSTHPVPTGDDDDPLYKPFAPLASTGGQVAPDAVALPVLTAEVRALLELGNAQLISVPAGLDTYDVALSLRTSGAYDPNGIEVLNGALDLLENLSADSIIWAPEQGAAFLLSEAVFRFRVTATDPGQPVHVLLRRLAGAAGGGINAADVLALIDTAASNVVVTLFNGKLVFTASTPPSNAASALVPITKYNANAGTLAAGNGHLAFSQFSYASLQHNGTSAKIGVWSNLPNNPTGSTDAQFAPNNDTNRSPVGIGIVDDGAPVTMPNGTQIASVTGIAADTVAGSIQYITVPLPGTGTRVTDFYNSYVQNYGSTGVLWGACVVSVEIFGTAVTAAELINITDGATVVVAESDSTGGGIQSDAPYLTGHIGQIKPLRPSYTFKLVGAGGARISNRYDTAAKRNLRADEAVAAWGNTANPVYLFGTNGINDWATSQATGAQMGAMVGLFFDELKSRKPNVKILLVSPYLTTIESGSDKLESAPNTRAGLETARNGRDSFVWYLDGSTLTNELYDPVHPNTVGYAQSAPKISAGLDFSTGAVGDSVAGAPLLFPNNTGTLVYTNELLTTSADDNIGDDTGYKESGVANWKLPAGGVAYVMMQNTVAGAGNAILGWNDDKQVIVTGRSIPVGMFLDPGTGDVYVKDTGVDQDGNTPGIQLYGRKIIALPLGHWVRILIDEEGSALLERSEDKLSWSIAYQFGYVFTEDAYPTAVLFCNSSAKMHKPQLGTGLVPA
ncbi:hypothetical protein [Hymenobacter sp.]|uniref:hypothetical protein n=1 Tax=Hymenobacter sp. TaxID=1898978 RepID=UPI00286D3DAE|nr:hypothetical protein [Hymenobacter sp.]